MKLRLPSILLSALVAAQMCTTANADTVVASGVSYDVGKANHHYSGAYTDYNEDYLHCWATSASNVIQNWQDKYSDNAVTSSLPNGVIASPAGSAEGTVNLDVYKTILDNSEASHAGTASEAFNWWFKNTASGGTLTSPREDGSYYDVFGTSNAGIKQSPSGWYFTGNDLKSAFAQSNGNAVTLTITQAGSVVPKTDPDLGSLSMGDSRSHSITCWGYETDNSGNVSAVYLSDSDDLSYGIFKANTEYTSRYNGLLERQFEWEGATQTGLYLDTDDKHDGYNGSFEVYVGYAELINTPAAANLNEGASTTAAAAPDAEGKVTQNTKLTADTAISSKGVTVGNEAEGKLVMLTSENGKALNLTGNDAKTSGLTVEHGSLASLDKVSISGYEGSGMELEGRGYLHDGTVSIKDNHATNGGAVKTSTYLEIEGNDKVEISGNSATNKGGGISNTGIVSIFGNKEVTFSDNTADKGGNDIYNAKGGIVNIYNNDKVEFKSSDGGAAVRNEGELYIANSAGNDVTFVNASLDSKGGKTYIGTDLDGNATNSTGGLKFSNDGGTETLRFLAASETVAPRTPVRATWMGERDGKPEEQVGFSHYEERTPAVLNNLSVSLNEINGVSADQSSISGADVVATGNLTASKITLDTTSTITANAITLNAVVIDLKGVEGAVDGDIITYDLSGLLTASTGVTMNNLVFDTNGLELTEGQQVVVTLGGNLAGTARLLTEDGLRNHVSLTDGKVKFFGNSPIVPEPATTTLSLLALAGLCARRRRH